MNPDAPVRGRDHATRRDIIVAATLAAAVAVLIGVAVGYFWAESRAAHRIEACQRATSQATQTRNADLNDQRTCLEGYYGD